MAETYLLISERPVGGTNRFAATNILFAIGAVLTDCRLVGDRGRRGQAPLSHLDALAREAGVRPLSEFISEDPESFWWRFQAEGGGEPPPGGPPPERWFTAAEGLATVRGLLDYLTIHTEAVAEVKQVIGDLRQFEAVLRDLEDEGVLWHLQEPW